MFGLERGERTVDPRQVGSETNQWARRLERCRGWRPGVDGLGALQSRENKGMPSDAVVVLGCRRWRWSGQQGEEPPSSDMSSLSVGLADNALTSTRRRGGGGIWGRLGLPWPDSG